MALFARFLLGGAVFGGAVFIACVSASAAETTEMSFGTIELYPGSSYVMIAAETGSAVPVSNRSLVTNGNSGQLILSSSSGTDQHVDIIYPETMVLYCGGLQVTVSDIRAHSQYSSTGVTLPGDGTLVRVNIGGVLQLQGNEIPCRYDGTLSLLLNYN